MEYIGYHKNWVCDAPVLEELTSIARMPLMCLRNGEQISCRISNTFYVKKVAISIGSYSNLSCNFYVTQSRFDTVMSKFCWYLLPPSYSTTRVQELIPPPTEAILCGAGVFLVRLGNKDIAV